MIAAKNWDLSDAESSVEAEPLTSQRDYSAAHPGKLGLLLRPVEYQALLWHLTQAALIPLAIVFGQFLHSTGVLPEILILSIVCSFFWGLYKYLSAVRRRAEYFEFLESHGRTGFWKIPSFHYMVVVPCLQVPLVMLLVTALALWSESQFLAVSFCAFICIYFFYWHGALPIEFCQEYLLAQPEIEPTDRRYRRRFDGSPDFNLLLSIVLLLLASAILGSPTLAFVGLAILLAGYLLIRVQRLGVHYWYELLRYLVKRSHSLLQVYVDQPDVDRHEIGAQWTPPMNRAARLQVFILLQNALHLVLLTGLTYYCPWDFFAWLTLPDFETAASGMSEGAAKHFWLVAPVAVAFQAKPLVVYLLSYLIAIAGFLVFPPAIFFALYFDRILALEEIYQEIKAVRRSYD